MTIVEVEEETVSVERSGLCRRDIGGLFNVFEKVHCRECHDERTGKVEPCLPRKLLLADHLHDLVVNQVEEHVAHEDIEKIVRGVSLIVESKEEAESDVDDGDDDEEN